MALPVSQAFEEALKSPYREIDVTCTIRNIGGDIRYGPYGLDIIDGEVVVDWDNHLDGPVHSASITFMDPDHTLDPDMNQGDLNNVWYNCKLDLRYGVKLPSGSFEYVPIFRGWVEEVVRTGATIEILGVGRENRHQAPRYALPKSWEVLEGTTYHQALHDLLNHRGIDDDQIAIPLPNDSPTFKRNKHYGLGMSPWRIMQSWARHLDLQLFYRQNGDIRLRDWPEYDEDVSWVFEKGDEGLVLEFPEQRFSMADLYNTVFVTTEKVVNDGPLAAERPEPVVGYATLPDADPLSMDTLSKKKKPLLRIVERPGIRSFADANAAADSILNKGKTGLNAEIALRCIPVPHLEPMDIVRLNYGSYGIDVHKFRLKRFTIPVMPDGEMTINWQGHRIPDPRRRKAHYGPVKGRRERVQQYQERAH